MAEVDPVQKTYEIYRETAIGLENISDAFAMSRTFGPKNPHQDELETAVSDFAATTFRAAVERESVSIEPLVERVMPWVSNELLRTAGSAAYSLFIKQQDEAVASLLAGTVLSAKTNQDCRPSIDRVTEGITQIGTHGEAIGVFFKADTNVGKVILRTEATDDLLSEDELQFRAWRPNSMRYVYWGVRLFDILSEDARNPTQTTTLEIVS